MILAYLTKYASIIRKFVPTNGEYRTDKKVRVKRGGVVFSLHLNDYMQWHVFANIKEPLWELAWKYLNKESVIFDVGANIGAFSLKTGHYLKNQKTKFTVHAFEPNGSILPLFERNIALNPELLNSICINSVALSNRTGVLYFDSNSVNSGSGKISSLPTEHKVEVTTIDEYVKAKKIVNIDLIKIDVEGHEPSVINGAQNTLSDHKPLLILEITDEWFKTQGSSATELFSMLKRLDYSFVSDISEKASVFDPDSEIKTPFQFNILAIHDSQE